MALKRPCCKSRCERNLTLKTVMTLVVTFWSLSKNSQDSLSLAISWKAAVSKPLYFLSFFLQSLWLRLWSLQNSSLMMDEEEPEDDGSESPSSSSSSSSSSSNSSSSSCRGKTSWFIQGGPFFIQRKNCTLKFAIYLPTSFPGIRYSGMQTGLAPNPGHWQGANSEMQTEFQGNRWPKSWKLGPLFTICVLVIAYALECEYIVGP